MVRRSDTTAHQLIRNFLYFILGIWLTACTESSDIEISDHATVVKQSQALVPLPPWPDKDERGMANTLGVGTSMRCAFHLNQADAKVYELSHLRSNDMPSSPWSTWC
jgi:hypothetical protein